MGLLSCNHWLKENLVGLISILGVAIGSYVHTSTQISLLGLKVSSIEQHQIPTRVALSEANIIQMRGELNKLSPELKELNQSIQLLNKSLVEFRVTSQHSQNQLSHIQQEQNRQSQALTVLKSKAN